MLFVSFLLACGTPAPDAHPPAASEGHGDAHAEADAPHHDDAHAHPHEAADAELVLTLDGTQRWQMDAHTRDVMAETRTTIASTELASVDEATALGATLKGQLDQLISGCTMDGAAHDELHVFLMAWIPQVTALQGTTELAHGQQTLATMKAMLVEYDRTFE